MKILSSCFWQQLINFAVYVFLRRFSLPAPLSFQKKRSFHFIWISQNLLGLLIRGGKALIQGQNSNPQPFISVLSNKCKVFKLSFLHVLFNLLFYGLRRFSWIGRSLAEQRFSQRWIWKNDWQWWWLNVNYGECVCVSREMITWGAKRDMEKNPKM